MGLIQGEYRQHPLCPAPAPMIVCPIAVHWKTGKAGSWIVVTHCHSCPNMRELRLHPGHEDSVIVNCKVAKNEQQG